MKPPAYLPVSTIGAPIDFPWDEPRAHQGPSQTVTKLLEMLWDTTTCGQLIMCAGILDWATWRFEGLTPTSYARDFCDAAFAHQVDQRYADRDAGGIIVKDPSLPPAESAVMAISRHLRFGVGPNFTSSYYAPVTHTFHSAHLLRHVLPNSDKKVFSKWLAALADRVRLAASKPDEEQKPKDEFESPEAHAAYLARHWGQPLPWEILDPDAEASPAGPLVAARLASLDWQSNVFLRSPQQMRELGFEGEPYVFPVSA